MGSWVLNRDRWYNFVAWRYLAEGHDASLTSNPYRLAAVAYAMFSLHVEETDLPEIGAP